MSIGVVGQSKQFSDFLLDNNISSYRKKLTEYKGGNAIDSSYITYFVNENGKYEKKYSANYFTQYFYNKKGDLVQEITTDTSIKSSTQSGFYKYRRNGKLKRAVRLHQGLVSYIYYYNRKGQIRKSKYFDGGRQDAEYKYFYSKDDKLVKGVVIRNASETEEEFYYNKDGLLKQKVFFKREKPISEVHYIYDLATNQLDYIYAEVFKNLYVPKLELQEIESDHYLVEANSIFQITEIGHLGNLEILQTSNSPFNGRFVSKEIFYNNAGVTTKVVYSNRRGRQLVYETIFD